MPEDVAVLGVDNDEVICRLCRPTLSTVEPDVERIGSLAAELIDAQLKGRKVSPSYQVPPRRIVERRSTDTVTAAHPAVVDAARLIRSSADISV